MIVKPISCLALSAVFAIKKLCRRAEFYYVRVLLHRYVLRCVKSGKPKLNVLIRRYNQEPEFLVPVSVSGSTIMAFSPRELRLTLERIKL